MKSIKTVSFSKHMSNGIPECITKFFMNGAKDEVDGIGNAAILFLALHMDDETDDLSLIAEKIGFDLEYCNELFTFLKDSYLLYEVPSEVLNCTIEEMMDDPDKYIKMEHDVVSYCIKQIEKNF